ncbi:MAG: hypothetical protein V1659_02295 [Candidatus Woesearchaeota archaeon]
MIKGFEEYRKEGIVKKVSPDKERAKSLILDSERKMNVLERQLKALGIDKDLANEYILLCYDSLMLLVRAHMLIKGYNASGQGAHEAEIAYMRLLGADENEIRFTDQMRYFRNGMLYYGTALDEEYAEKVIKFAKEACTRLRRTASRNGKAPK